MHIGETVNLRLRANLHKDHIGQNIRLYVKMCKKISEKNLHYAFFKLKTDFSNYREIYGSSFYQYIQTSSEPKMLPDTKLKKKIHYIFAGRRISSEAQVRLGQCVIYLLTRLLAIVARASIL